MSKVKFGDIIKDVKINVDRDNNPYEFYVAGDHMDSEDLNIRRRGRFATDDVGPAFTRIFKKGQVLYGSRRTYLKKVAVADFDGICANTTFVFESKNPAAFEQKLLPFLMLSEGFTNWSIAHSKGSTNPYVLFSDLASYEFDLPSLTEQKVLAEKLWAAYEVKQSYLKMIAATEEMIEASYKKMIETSDRENCLGDYIVRMSAQKCGNRELPVLSITKDKGIVFQSERFESVVVSVDKSGYIIAPKGCLVQGIHIDECNFGIQKIVEEGIVSPAYKLWSFKGDDFIPELIEYYLRSPMAIKYFQMKFLGATVRRRQVISKDDFLSMPLNLPSFDGQKTYYDFFVKANKSISELRKSVDAIDKVINSLINENL